MSEIDVVDVDTQGPAPRLGYVPSYTPVDTLQADGARIMRANRVRRTALLASMVLGAAAASALCARQANLRRMSTSVQQEWGWGSLFPWWHHEEETTTTTTVTTTTSPPEEGGDLSTTESSSAEVSRTTYTKHDPIDVPKGNPFKWPKYYVNPASHRKFKESVESAKGKTKEALIKMQNTPTAIWVATKAQIADNSSEGVEAILQDAASKTPPELVTFIWYNLPNRDCDAKASTGEICCTKNKDGSCDYDTKSKCADGLKEYKTEFVDPFVKLLVKYDKQLPVVVIVEPDSLPNLATNLEHPHCGNPATVHSYHEGVKYTVHELTKKTSAAVYIDAANGAWIGWANHVETFMHILKNMSLPMKKVRGFTTNVAKYQPLGEMCPWEPDQAYRNAYCLNGQHADKKCCEDPRELLGQWNPGQNELNFAQSLVKAAKDVLKMDAHMVIDTSRNGLEKMSANFANWCNLRGAGAGHVPTAKTAAPDVVDAYFWLKTPGESDGCSETLPSGDKCKRFDENCKSDDALGTEKDEPKAPEAGEWFDFQVKQLADQANFGAEDADDGDGDSTTQAGTEEEGGDDDGDVGEEADDSEWDEDDDDAGGDADAGEDAQTA